jgi:2-dehydropantoate 2-reductase
MKISVMGAGAVGCYYGGMLARAGHEVVLIGRPAHVEAIRERGLNLDTQAFQAFVPLTASTDVSDIRGSQLVLCCVKSTDTEQAAAEMAPFLTPDSQMLSLQNGVENAERLQILLPCQVAPAVVYVAAEMAGAGHVKHHGRGELVVETAALSPELSALFGTAGIPLQTSDNVAGALWEKLILNCVYNALSAITQLPYGMLVQGDGVEELMHTVLDECLTLAEAEGIAISENIWAAVRAIADTMPTQLSSTAQDLARGKRSEIDHLNGFIVRRGKVLNIATPVNQTLTSLTKLIERKFA